MGFGFDGFSVLFTLMFVVIFGLFLVTIIRNLSNWNKNNHSPRLTVEAAVVARRGQTYHHHHNDGAMTSSTSYHVTFEVASGDRMELQVPAYTTATATPDPSHICNLHHSSWQRQILNALSKARDQT